MCRLIPELYERGRRMEQGLPPTCSYMRILLLVASRGTWHDLTGSSPQSPCPQRTLRPGLQSIRSPFGFAPSGERDGQIPASNASRPRRSRRVLCAANGEAVFGAARTVAVAIMPAEGEITPEHGRCLNCPRSTLICLSIDLEVNDWVRDGKGGLCLLLCGATKGAEGT